MPAAAASAARRASASLRLVLAGRRRLPAALGDRDSARLTPTRRPLCRQVGRHPRRQPGAARQRRQHDRRGPPSVEPPRSPRGHSRCRRWRGRPRWPWSLAAGAGVADRGHRSCRITVCLQRPLDLADRAVQVDARSSSAQAVGRGGAMSDRGAARRDLASGTISRRSASVRYRSASGPRAPRTGRRRGGGPADQQQQRPQRGGGRAQGPSAPVRRCAGSGGRAAIVGPGCGRSRVGLLGGRLCDQAHAVRVELVSRDRSSGARSSRSPPHRGRRRSASSWLSSTPSARRARGRCRRG